MYVILIIKIAEDFLKFTEKRVRSSRKSRATENRRASSDYEFVFG